ncbi:MAG: hypothetical protein IJ043_11000 [Clostridia bacterium]|nr:hypothetical protein [Clostridia bacterium]
MKHKKLHLQTAAILGIILLFLTLFGFWFTNRFITLNPAFYTDNKALEAITNDRIKSLALEAVKDQCIEENGNIICLIDRNFMKTVLKGDDGNYSGFIRSCFTDSVSEDCNYHFTISPEGKLIFFGVDA